MRFERTTNGPFVERPRFTAGEFESIAAEALLATGLFPSSPEPIRIDRFVDRRFGKVTRYELLDPGILGYTEFGAKGVEGVVVSRALDEDPQQVSQRRVRTTLAHEAGHGLLHAYLFAEASSNQTALLFDSCLDVGPTKILCRTDPGQGTGDAGARAYDGRWWEYQANQVMGALLVPKTLLDLCLSHLLRETGTLGLKVLEEEDRAQAAQMLEDTFDVNGIFARIRLGNVYPVGNGEQLTL